jgi:predicted dehydrogenase
VSNLSIYPDQIFVLGGGRWARVIAGVLCDFLPNSIPITLCSPTGYFGLLEWVNTKSLASRLTVQKQWPAELSSGSTAVIVANAAHEHVKAARWALERGASVLVEKPLATSLDDFIDLCSYANNCSGILAAGHVLRFNRFLKNYSDLLPNLNDILSISIEWVDSRAEHRYGDIKQYDSAVPVYLDCLPHVVSILQTIFNELPVFDKLIAIEFAGSKVILALTIGGRPCKAVMQRNGSDRVRLITVESSNEIITLDFTKEPGFIKYGENKLCADQNWDTHTRPLLSMLQNFLIAANGGSKDNRLSLDTASTAINISEKIKPIYQSMVMPWLIEYLESKRPIDDSILYAISEFNNFNLKQKLSN